MTAWLRLRRVRLGPLGVDVTLAVASFMGGLLVFGLGNYRQMIPSPNTPPPLFVVTLAGACVAVALRRVATRSSLALGTAAVVVDLVLGGSLATLLVYTQVLNDACLYGSPRMWRGLLWGNVALTGVGAVVGIALVGSWRGTALAVLVLVVGVLPVLTGISARQYRDRAVAERARAEQTARLAELDRRQAITAERTRMARELHDVIANHLSAVAIHATAALSVRGLEQAQLDQALRVIRENSVQGLAEMRQMIGLLRDPAWAGLGTVPTQGGVPAPASAPPPIALGALPPTDEPVRVRLAEVDRLIVAAREAGLPVRVETVGEPRPLPVSVDLAAYRIVQESLTNALKHGGGPTVLAVDYGPGLVRLTVENPLPEAVSDGSDLPGAGAGLIGMRERAALLGGQFDAGPHGPRWRVHAELPTAEALA